jgi:ABC-type Fe3+-siderophore transport system permease subunit
MKRTGLVALIGIVASVAAAMLPGDAGQALGPFVFLSSAVLLLAAWVVAYDHTPSHANAGKQKKSA